MGPEYEISNEVKPYLDKTVEWNPETQRFEGIFWGTLQSGDFEYRGWVTVDASDSTAYIPVEFEVQAVEGPEGEISDHPFLGKTFDRSHPMLDEIEYEL